MNGTRTPSHVHRSPFDASRYSDNDSASTSSSSSTSSPSSSPSPPRRRRTPKHASPNALLLQAAPKPKKPPQRPAPPPQDNLVQRVTSRLPALLQEYMALCSLFQVPPDAGVAVVLQSRGRLRHLVVSPAFHVGGLVPLVEVLKRDNTITSIDLRGRGLGSAVCHAVRTLLTVNTTITSVNVGGNGIDKYGARSLAHAMRQPSCSLVTLLMRGNAVGFQGAQKVAEALQENTSIKFLDLGENGIELAGVELLRIAARKRNAAAVRTVKGFDGAAQVHVKLDGNAPRPSVGDALWQPVDAIARLAARYGAGGMGIALSLAMLVQVYLSVGDATGDDKGDAVSASLLWRNARLVFGLYFVCLQLVVLLQSATRAWPPSADESGLLSMLPFAMLPLFLPAAAMPFFLVTLSAEPHARVVLGGTLAFAGACTVLLVFVRRHPHIWSRLAIWIHALLMVGVLLFAARVCTRVVGSAWGLASLGFAILALMRAVHAFLVDSVEVGVGVEKGEAAARRVRWFGYVWLAVVGVFAAQTSVWVPCG